MDVLPSGNIFHELQVVHDTGYYDGKVSPEEHWQQVGHLTLILLSIQIQFGLKIIYIHMYVYICNLNVPATFSDFHILVPSLM